MINFLETIEVMTPKQVPPLNVQDTNIVDNWYSCDQQAWYATNYRRVVCLTH